MSNPNNCFTVVGTVLNAQEVTSKKGNVYLMVRVQPLAAAPTSDADDWGEEPPAYRPIIPMAVFRNCLDEGTSFTDICEGTRITITGHLDEYNNFAQINTDSVKVG